MIAEHGVAADLREALVAEVRGLVVENPADAACEVGPLITGDARAAAVAAVERAADAGGRVLAGGTAIEGAGHYLAPALVEVSDPGAELAQEEVFAPVAAVLEARDAAHAVELTNGVRYGLSTSIFTRDLDRVARPGAAARHRPRAREPADVGCRPARTVRRREGLGARPAGAGEGGARALHLAADDSRVACSGRIVTRSKSGGAE